MTWLPDKKIPRRSVEGLGGGSHCAVSGSPQGAVTTRRRLAAPPRKEVQIPGFPTIRVATITELREGLDEDMERLCWQRGPIDTVDMESLGNRMATLAAREESES
ncbi:hypothetical protein [Azospirillum sp.]|uniref:hypothetical protein n=1 Tax=Azospirillum sp. TaxID=34012 RepID=UPI002D37795C|nr:hypothetical protein [Azospirillum sp.]HYD68497.1 hypothetical protein [Azospirillum sp.]